MVSPQQRQQIISLDGDVSLYNDFIANKSAAILFATLMETIEWRQESIQLYGKMLPSPRLTAWYGDNGKRYSYSGITLQASPWTAELEEIKNQLYEELGLVFNSVLLNLYRNGQDSVGWHSDAEQTLGDNPTIASISLGATRRFLMQHKKHKTEKVALDLPAGSLLLTQGVTQHYWRHCVPKTKRTVGPRINLTFRIIKSIDE